MAKASINVIFQVRQAVLEILDSANLEDFPMAVRFILQSVTDDDCVQVSSLLFITSLNLIAVNSLQLSQFRFFL